LIFLSVENGPISRDNLQLFKGHTDMTQAIQSIARSAVAGLMATIPFMALQSVNTHNFWTDFPIAVFGSLWVFAAVFIGTIGAILNQARMPGKTMARKMLVVAGIVFAFAVAMIWFGFVVDQMPCFLGVPNCD
jgi:hypothetical protein